MHWKDRVLLQPGTSTSYVDNSPWGGRFGTLSDLEGLKYCYAYSKIQMGIQKWHHISQTSMSLLKGSRVGMTTPLRDNDGKFCYIGVKQLFPISS